jgi:serine/threonine-protein kinase
VERGNAVVLHEARVLAFLGEHPNLPRLEGVGRRGDGHVVVTEWLEPQDLRARWGRDPPLPAVVELIAQLCSALQHMHARGAVHTALRPDNLVVTVEGHLKLIDFGRTKLGGEPAPEGYFLSGSDVLKGAFDFVSPEQVLGEPASPAADIFSAGALLYALACRRPPFAGHSGLAVLEAIQNVACPAPRSLRPELPAAIEAVIQRAMERDPAARFPTALAMHDALAQARQAQGWGAGTAQLAPTAAL